MNWLRQSTASQQVLLGPFLDDTDGKTAETGLTIANTDIKVWKAGGTSESNKNSGGATHIASGRYYTVLDATDTDTAGSLELNVHVAGALPVKVRCLVMQSDAYDQFVLGSFAKLGVAGVCTTGGTTTSIPTSSLAPAAAVTDQFKGRTLIFDDDTTTANLRGQATNITASTSGGTLTVTALTTAPVNGDTFRIV